MAKAPSSEADGTCIKPLVLPSSILIINWGLCSALDQFGQAPADITNAYICWALSQAKLPAELFAQELDHVVEGAEKGKKDDPYYLSALPLSLSPPPECH